MAYANPTVVYARDTGRNFTATSRPSTQMVSDYCEQTAAELDGILRARGYTIPIATTATSALRLLEHGNALGAAAMIEQTAVTGAGKRGDAFHLWEEFKKHLLGDLLELDAAKDATDSVPSFGGTGESGFPATPMFPLTMEP